MFCNSDYLNGELGPNIVCVEEHNLIQNIIIIKLWIYNKHTHTQHTMYHDNKIYNACYGMIVCPGTCYSKPLDNTGISLSHAYTLGNTHIDKIAYQKTSKRIINVYYIVHSSRLYAKYWKHLFPNAHIQEGPQLNLWNGYGLGLTRGMDLSISLQKTHHSYKCCTWHRISTSSKVAATTRKLFEQNVESIDTSSNSQKRQVNAMVVSSQKKAKGKGVTPPRPPFWLGYQAFNALTMENGDSLERTLSVSELVKRGMTYEEALEHLVAIPSFPYIPQEAWPSQRMDGKEGGHINLTQVPFDIEVDEEGFALDYQIAIAFELYERNLTKD